MTRRLAVILAAPAFAGLVLFGAHSVFGASASPSDPLTYQKRLHALERYDAEGRWEWISKQARTTTTITGTSQWRDRGGSVVWTERGFGQTTVLTLSDGYIITETGEKYAVGSPEGEERLRTDMFAAQDPLETAARHQLLLHSSGRELTGSGPCVSDSRADCVASLKLQIDADGVPTRATFELRHVHGVDRIEYRYDLGA